MSNKLYFLYSHLDRFLENLGDLSDDQGERFHQNVSEMEVRYQGKWDAAMLDDYCWSIKHDDAFAIHSQRLLKGKFMADIWFDHFKGFHCQYACLNPLIWLVIGRSKKLNMQLHSYNNISSFCCKHCLSSFRHYSGCIIAGKLDLIEKNWLQFWSQHPKN